MDFDILDLIYWEYEGSCFGYGIKEETKNTIEFKKKYIAPVLNENSDKDRHTRSEARNAEREKFSAILRRRTTLNTPVFRGTFSLSYKKFSLARFSEVLKSRFYCRQGKKRRNT